MPSKKKKYNARFPAGRIKKIMQSDEEVGKVAQAVPVIISRTLELFVESLLTKTLRITHSRNAKTLSPSHMKQCIMSESRFDFLRELVKNIPDISIAEESLSHDSGSSPGPQQQSDNNSNSSSQQQQQQRLFDYRMPSTSCEASAAAAAAAAIASSSNGNLSIIKNGGMQILPAVDLSGNKYIPTATEQKPNLKRQWEVLSTTTANEENRKIIIKGTKTLTIRNEITTDGSVPAKLMRMDSAPIINTTITTTEAASATATTTTSDINKYSARRLQHQSKSIPCTSKEANCYQQQKQHLPELPAPIVDINICNKPIVKIDYSNLVLPDKDSSNSGSSSDPNSMNTFNINPVINIDLSKITAAQSSSSCGDLQTVSISASSVKSTTLELDEDYDNI